MHLGIKEILIYAAVGFTAALAVNYYAGLNIPILNQLQEAVIPGSMDHSFKPRKADFSASPDKFTGYQARPDCARAKTSGDARLLMRKRLEDAEKERDEDTASSIREQLAEMDRQEREACR